MAQAAAKRFYKTAETAASDDGGFLITLDGRPVKTPRGAPLRLPTAALADAVAAEWAAQTDAIRPDTMPMTQLATTAIDRMTVDRDDVVAALAAYATTDLLCYRADGPDELVRRQALLWQPLLDWAAETFQAPLTVTTGVLPVAQPAASLGALSAAVAALGPFELAVLGTVTPVTGSLILGLAFINGRLNEESIIEAAFVDEDFQAERWGEDDEAMARRAAIKREIEAAALFGRLQ